MQVGKQHIDLSSPKVMAIVNLTPDSFFDGGRYIKTEAVHHRIEKVIEEGADIIDLGAYSTRPGAAKVDLEDEWKRLVPALSFIRKNYKNIPISIDTFRAEIADRVLKYFGSFIVNDISAGTLDKNLFSWVGEHKMPYILMHIKGTPQDMQQNPVYDDVVSEVYDFLKEKLSQLRDLGAGDVIIDLGFGFGKTITHNYQLLREIKAFDSLQCPMLVGISRKSMIYKLLNTEAKEALNGTTVLNTMALERGAKILRVHDAKEAKEAVALVSAMQNA
ncbi:dihydropteroate synthase [Balneicella halophila]|uniref:Dihydropteroate synthase n=1 Tax=Balneicella halophila TaxID=1537566 RepID=A0A7L4UPM4_BALHA|nr:dihydropteroate synthase [Balneicella halophila]PVX51745.1 dihydropteroate synthase [Balneicella halophila]